MARFAAPNHKIYRNFTKPNFRIGLPKLRCATKYRGIKLMWKIFSHVILPRPPLLQFPISLRII